MVRTWNDSGNQSFLFIVGNPDKLFKVRNKKVKFLIYWPISQASVIVCPNWLVVGIFLTKSWSFKHPISRVFNLRANLSNKMYEFLNEQCLVPLKYRNRNNSKKRKDSHKRCNRIISLKNFTCYLDELDFFFK